MQFSVATVIVIGGFADGNNWASLQSPETLVAVAMAMLWNGAVVSAGATYAMAEGQKSSRMAPSQVLILTGLLSLPVFINKTLICPML